MSPSPRRRSPNANGNTTVRGLMQYARSNFRKAASAAKVQFIMLGMTVGTATLLVKKMVDAYDERYNEPGRKYNRNLAAYTSAKTQWNKECRVGGMGGIGFKKGTTGWRPVACPISRPQEPNRPRVSLGSDITALRKSVSIMNLAWIALIVLIIEKIVVTVASTWVSAQKGRLAGVALRRAKTEARHIEQVGQQTVNTAANFRNISAPLLEAAKEITKGIAQLEMNLTKVILSNGETSPNIAVLEAKKAALEKLLKSKIPLIQMSTGALVEFQRMLTAPEKVAYQRLVNETIQQTHQITGEISANLNTKGVGAAAAAATSTAANLARTAGAAYITGGGSLLLKGRQANQSPPKRPSPPRLTNARRQTSPPKVAPPLLAIQAPRKKTPSPPKAASPRKKTPSPTRRRSPNSRNANNTLNNVLKQFN